MYWTNKIYNYTHYFLMIAEYCILFQYATFCNKMLKKLKNRKTETGVQYAPPKDGPALDYIL